jgi:V-type H+-transporting ATPase subunit E
MESSVMIQCRSCDTAIVDQASQSAKSNYKDISGREVEVEIDGCLSKDSAGGVRLIAAGSKITVDNTLDERLKLLEEKVCPSAHLSVNFLCKLILRSKMLPEIRHELFGVNENRKFYT